MTIAKNIQEVREKIYSTLLKNNRSLDSLCLVGVTKGHPSSVIREAYAAGLCHFGENYWQEAHVKKEATCELPLIWHFLGPIQSNKASFIAQTFDWVHSIDRLKIASLLDKHRPRHLLPLQVCIQVNIDGELKKSGVSPVEALPLVQAMQSLKNLQVRGLMAIPKPCSTKQDQYKSFHRFSLLLNKINQQLSLNLDSLSMGMSDDFTTAIDAGSTIVRIGRAIFGERSI